MQRTELERLAASVLCVGFPGAHAGEAPLDALVELAPGGIILFARNVVDVSQTARLTAAIRDAFEQARVPQPFVAADQEGGRVARLRAGARELPPMMAVGAAGDVELAEQLGAQAAADLVRAGITVDFAPCLDLALQPANTVIGARSFGDDPAAAAALGVAFARGLERGGVHATIKHFPGHGSTAVDSHLALPVIDEPLDVLRTRDLRPFADAVRAGGVAVMTAHIVARSIDPVYPATLSKRVLTDLLRTELGFDGVCFTDDLEMDAIAATYGVARGAALAIAAGADCALISHTPALAREAVREIARDVERGVIPLDRLKQASARIARLRRTGADASAFHGDPAAEVARRAVTVLRGDVLLAPGSAVTIVSFEGTIADGAAGVVNARGSLSLALRRKSRKAGLMRVALDPSGDETDALRDVIATAKPQRLIVMTRRAHLYPGQRRAVLALLELVPAAVIVSAAEPFDLTCFPHSRTAVAIYGDGDVSIEGLAEIMCGETPASGVLPVALLPEASA